MEPRRRIPRASFHALSAIVATIATVGTVTASLPEPDTVEGGPQSPPRVVVYAGTGGNGYFGDGGPATEALLCSPHGIAVDVEGNLYIAEVANRRIRRVHPGGMIETVAGSGPVGLGLRGIQGGYDGPALRARFHRPHSLAADAKGRLFISDWLDHRVRTLTPDGIITTVAGTGKTGFSGDGGPATKAMLRSPFGLAVDGEGNLLIADTGNRRVRKVDARGIITTIVGGGDQVEGSRASEVRLAWPSGLALDAAGNLYISEQHSHRVRKVTSNGTVTTVAGTGKEGHSGDGGPATKAMLRHPTDLAADRAGSLFIVTADGVRKVASDGTITTVAGAWTVPVKALLHNRAPVLPFGVAIDSAGNLFVSYNAHFVVRITGVAAPGVLPATPKSADEPNTDETKPAERDEGDRASLEADPGG